MPKKGQRAVARVTFRWDNDVNGSISCLSLDEADMKAEQLLETAERSGRSVAVTVETIQR